MGILVNKNVVYPTSIGVIRDDNRTVLNEIGLLNGYYHSCGVGEIWEVGARTRWEWDRN